MAISFGSDSPKKTMRPEYRYILDNADGLADGESLRLLCPFCNAQHEERSFSVSKKGNNVIQYRCWRASCGAHGALSTSGKPLRDYSHQNTNRRQPKPLTMPIEAVPANVEEELLARYELSPLDTQEEGFGYISSTNSLAMPIRDVLGRSVGYVTKYLGTDKARLKYMVYFDLEPPKYAVSSRSLVSSNKTCVLVEDVLSSVKVAKLVPSVALLGTFLSEASLMELLTLYDRFIIMLDPGAEKNAYRIYNKYKLVAPMELRFVNKDPKEMSYDELKSRILPS